MAEIAQHDLRNCVVQFFYRQNIYIDEVESQFEYTKILFAISQKLLYNFVNI